MFNVQAGSKLRAAGCLFICNFKVPKTNGMRSYTLKNIFVVGLLPASFNRLHKTPMGLQHILQDSDMPPATQTRAAKEAEKGFAATGKKYTPQKK